MKAKIKEKIIDVIVVAIMVIIANYPLYKSLKETASEMNDIIISVQTEVIAWKKDVDIAQGKIEGVRIELSETINRGIGQTQNVLNKIQSLESQTKTLNNKIDTFQANIEHKIDSLRTQSFDKVKDAIDFDIFK